MPAIKSGASRVCGHKNDRDLDMNVRAWALLATLLIWGSAAQADEPERDTLYKVTTLRAAPGELEQLIDVFSALKQEGFYNDAGRHAPWILRHSQGDHWDLMLVEAIGDYTSFFSAERLEATATAETTHKAQLGDLNAIIAFQEDVFAWGPSREVLGADFDSAGLYHIEMFRALPGLLGSLIEQREMENEYLTATSQVANYVFVSDVGSDIDVFTIGTHESLSSFAASPELEPEALNLAATEAGFESRATIGFYLRSLIAGHNDTLATPVR
jgi:hypothetical protein